MKAHATQFAAAPFLNQTLTPPQVLVSEETCR